MKTRPDEITFYGDTLLATCGLTGEVLVALKPIIEALGLDWSGQLKKLRTDPDLSMEEISIESPAGPRRMLCLPLHLVPAMLTQIKPSAKMTAAAREKLSLYRREAFAVLWEHFGPAVRGAVSRNNVPLFTLDDIRTEVRDAVRLELAVQRPPPTLTPLQQREVHDAVNAIA